MEHGLYETVVTRALQARLAVITDSDIDLQAVDDADQTHVLARHAGVALHRVLASTTDETRRLEILRRVLDVLQQDDDQVVAPVRQLWSVQDRPGPGRIIPPDVRPATPLSDAALLTNSARGEPSLAAELSAELDSADEVDLLCAFVKWHGLRLLEAQLTRLRERGAALRVITTTYLGATERKALDRLVVEFGATVKIQYDTLRTRLHAKAWMFHRRTDFDTAYVGSSNLSRAALLDGVEWNVRLSRVGTPSLLDKFQATFDTYWNDSSFETYDPDRDRDRLDDALAEASGQRDHDRVTLSLSGLEVRPYPYQLEMLEALATERLVHDRHRNLLIAATGTGKTVVAALDYRDLAASWPGGRPRLLFVAHRREILTQALRTYREVLVDADFGELYVAGHRPERWQHVFASVQSLTSYGVQQIPPDAFDIVVIDEFHHAQARTYRRLIDHLHPRELLGLTATPERSDGLDVRTFFGGRTAASLRLWDALGADLLCPFHYFAVADGTDLRRVAWTRGRYDDGELGTLFTGNRARAAVVLQQVRAKILEPGAMRALGFCVSVAHAEFMAQVFNDAGVPARAVSGATAQTDRVNALRDLRDQRVNVLFAADLFNEGLDLPEVDTLLMLRPTESATVFLQQLGRGLRRTRDKAVLTVMDFVGLHRKEFRFDQKLRALTGRTRKQLITDVERNFPFLPSGCQILMDRQSQQIVLDNIRQQVAQRWPQIVAELRRSGDQDLATFLDETGLELADVLRGSHTWTGLRREAGLPTRPGSVWEDKLLRRVRALAHVDDPDRHRTYRRLLTQDVGLDDLSEAERRLARMLHFSLYYDGGGHQTYDAGLAALRAEGAARDELAGVVDLSFDQTRHVCVQLGGDLAHLPLRVHAHYHREEALAGLEYADLGRRPNSFREGVLYSRALNVDAFFVTLRKSEADYSPTTMYRDYPISPSLFHWESQSTTTVDSVTGRRYLNGSSHVLLFVRDQKENALGTAPYLFAGPAHYVSHQGERPIAITWRLEHPFPADFFTTATVAAS